MAISAPLAALEGVDAGYGEARVLFGLDLAVHAGEVVTLMGRNGMGKTTTIRTLFGLVTPSAGRVVSAGFFFVNRKISPPRRKGAKDAKNAISYPVSLAKECKVLVFFAKLCVLCALALNN